MRNFNRGNNRFGGGRDFNRRDSRMFKTTCSKCGNECEVPFKPTGMKPVYCDQCFRSNRQSEPRRFEERNTGGGGNSGEQYKKQLESINWKLDKILKILTPAVTPEVVQEVVKTKTKKKKPIVKEEAPVLLS